VDRDQRVDQRELVTSTPTASHRGRFAAGALALALGLAGCASGTPPTPAAAPGSGSSSSSSADELRLVITITGSTVSPNGKKVDARVGQQVVLDVTSDAADEVHAHTGGDGYELEVPAGRPTTGRFTLDSPGSFEIESHRLEKVLVILNVR
jgi:hypothetical protein